MMTVAELEAQMQAGGGATGKELQRLEKIRQQIAAQSVEDTETVVGTMRGWLRENS